jgi:putative endonuclease
VRWAITKVRTGTHVGTVAAASTPTASTTLNFVRIRTLRVAQRLWFQPMKYVYLLKSLSDPEQRYIGSTSDLQARLQQHNQGRVCYTAKHLPWEIHVAVRFQNDRRAEEFERYLKSGSGHAFANRHLW